MITGFLLIALGVVSLLAKVVPVNQQTKMTSSKSIFCAVRRYFNSSGYWRGFPRKAMQ
jgi:hypothetical protein